MWTNARRSGATSRRTPLRSTRWRRDSLGTGSSPTIRAYMASIRSTAWSTSISLAPLSCCWRAESSSSASDSLRQRPAARDSALEIQAFQKGLEEQAIELRANLRQPPVPFQASAHISAASSGVPARSESFGLLLICSSWRSDRSPQSPTSSEHDHGVIPAWSPAPSRPHRANKPTSSSSSWAAAHEARFAAMGIKQTQSAQSSCEPRQMPPAHDRQHQELVSLALQASSPLAHAPKGITQRINRHGGHGQLKLVERAG